MVDQLNRLPSNQAQMELSPGKNVGGSEVLVKNTPQKPWRAGLSRSNDGQRSTGEQQWGTTFDWDSPLGLADQLMLRGGHDAMTDHQHTSSNAMLYYNVPWGWWNFSYIYSQSEYRSQIAANGYNFKQTGDSQNHQLRAERVIHRDAVSKTSLNAGLSYLRTNNFIEDSKLKLSSNRISEMQYGINHGRRIGSAFVNLDLGMQEGIGAFDAQGNHHPGPGEPNARYRKYTATATYQQPFKLWGESFNFSSLMTGQRSETCCSARSAPVCGQSSIRGYKDHRCPATAAATGATTCAGPARSPGMAAPGVRRVRHQPRLRPGRDQRQSLQRRSARAHVQQLRGAVRPRSARGRQRDLCPLP
jgi:hemolysin activation/secretion protein